MGEVDIRELREDDEAAVLALLAASMGWQPDEAYAAYFRWKHVENPFGRSPGWVAESGGALVGLRVFMRWGFADGERRYRAVRAVDTATHPEHQGKGVFKRLTLHGLEALAAEGVDFVFNTPNEQSKPGYLKMGWSEVGKLPVALRVRSPLVAAKLVRSRVAAEREPLPTDVGEPAPERLAEIADDLPVPSFEGRLATERSPAFLRWRYGLSQLGYRVWTPSADPAEGAICFRLRRRGKATELVVNDLLLPPDAEAMRLIGRLVKATGADHALAIAAPRSVEGALAPPGLGPVLTWKGVTQEAMPPLEAWALAMGDVELF